MQFINTVQQIEKYYVIIKLNLNLQITFHAISNSGENVEMSLLNQTIG